MDELPRARTGTILEINGRAVDFSFFPTQETDAGCTLADTVFAVSPWAVIRGAINKKVDEHHRIEATAFLQQAQDFYATARERLAANPLLFYYAFLNLGKALLRARGFSGSLDRAHHGLGDPPSGALGLEGAELRVRNFGDRTCIFPELLALLGGAPLRDKTVLPIRDLLRQVVVGHRQWRDAAGVDESFVRLEQITFMHDPAQNAVWVRYYVDPADLGRFNISVERFVAEAIPDGSFHPVFSDISGWHCFESTQATAYHPDLCGALLPAAKRARPNLWRIVSSIPGTGYRRYYGLLTPPTSAYRLPQIASLWAVLFYLGSIVRYRPHVFDELHSGPYGPFVNEFVSAQPEQLLYMLASEICEREIAKPAIA